MGQIDLTIFHLSPIAMWLQDFSGIKQIFDQWTAEGIVDIRQYLLSDLTRLHPCLAAIKTLNINDSVLELYEAENLEEILEKFSQMHTDETALLHVEFFSALWNKKKNYGIPAINYTCKGKKIDIQLRANILPGYEDSWECLLLTTENISDYQNARRFAESVFTHSPSPLLLKDYSKIKTKLDKLRQNGVTDLKRFLSNHPLFLNECFNQIEFYGVNQATLNLFHVQSKLEFIRNLNQIFSIHANQSFFEQLIQLWEGNYIQQRESRYHTIDGKIINVLENFTVFPEYENNWQVVQVALINITEHKEKEDYLTFLGQHDTLTQLNNRTFYIEEIQRIKQNPMTSISCVFLDINGLKHINDTLGHDQGDLILKRFGQILKNAIADTHYSASRIGGDEFVILMPNTKHEDLKDLLHNIQNELHADQVVNIQLPIHVAIGFAMTNQSKKIDQMLKEADLMMYKMKQEYYLSHSKKI